MDRVIIMAWPSQLSKNHHCIIKAVINYSQMSRKCSFLWSQQQTKPVGVTYYGHNHRPHICTCTVGIYSSIFTFTRTHVRCKEDENHSNTHTYTYLSLCLALSQTHILTHTTRQWGQCDLCELRPTHHFPVITGATSNPISIRRVLQRGVCVYLCAQF